MADTANMADLKGRLNNCNAPRFTRMQDLQQGVPYEVSYFSKTQSRYGEAVCAIVKASGGELLNLYLPRRFLTILTDATIESYNSGEAERISFMYRGNSKGIEFM